MSALLKVTDAHVAYGKVEAVRSVSLEVGDNEIVTIIGANGAGKTTLLNAIMGILPLKGGVTFAGEDMAQLEIEDRVAAGLSLVPEHRELFGTMNVEDNLQLGAFRIAKAVAAQSFERVYTLFPRLKERRKQLAGTLSGGEQQMLAMGRALMGAPKLLMLDEPSLGLAPIIVADIFRTIGELRAAGVSVLLVEQNAQAALKIADRAYVMELGEFILNGPASDIATNRGWRRAISAFSTRARAGFRKRVGKGALRAVPTNLRRVRSQDGGTLAVPTLPQASTPSCPRRRASSTPMTVRLTSACRGVTGSLAFAGDDVGVLTSPERTSRPSRSG